MVLKTKTYEPVGDAIWLEYDVEALSQGSNLVMPGNMKLPPFVEAEVMAAGPKCLQVKKGDVVIVNSSVMTQIKVVGEEPVLFTKEGQVVAIVRGALDRGL